MNLYLTTSGRLSRKDNTLSFEQVNIPDGPDVPEEIAHEFLDEAPCRTKKAIPVETVSAIYVFGEINLNSRLLNFLAQKKIPLHIFNYYGHHTGTFTPHPEQLSGDLVLRQAEAHATPELKTFIGRKILDAAFCNIHSILGYYARKYPRLCADAEQIQIYRSALQSAATPDELMGVEGSVRKLYYSDWTVWLGEIAAKFKRVYYPPDTPLNSLISFINSLLYTACVSELYRTALYPGISYIHSPQSRRYSLALDLVEPFKPVMADRLVFRLLNSGAISDADFMRNTNGFVLTDAARKKILTEWDMLLRQTIHLKKLGRSISYQQLLRHDCYKLIRFLFERDEYEPFRMEY